MTKAKERIYLNDDTPVDLLEFLESRGLVQANSGGGKSWLIRRLVEQAFGKTQVIILDTEGEFSTLRERYDFVLAGRGGDTAADPKTAALLARRALEHKFSLIVDLSDLTPQEKKHYVRLFTEAMMQAPKELWPINFARCILVIDEAHRYCPQAGESEAMDAVINAADAGRKRGVCVVLATQRISKLHKDAAAECNNKMIGRSSLDVDMKRAADELGFTKREDQLTLRILKPGEFYVFGPAICDIPTQVKIGDVQTTHTRAGARGKVIKIPPTAKIKALLPKLEDLPKEAEDEATLVQRLQQEIHQLKTARVAPVVEGPSEEKIQDRIDAAVSARDKQWDKVVDKWDAWAADVINFVCLVEQDAAKMYKKRGERPPMRPDGVVKIHAPARPVEAKRVIETVAPRNLPPPTGERVVYTGSIKGGAARMLAVLAARPSGLPRIALGVLSLVNPSGGSFGTYLGALKSAGYVVEEGDILITNDGIAYARENNLKEMSHDERVSGWRNNLKGGARRMFDHLLSVGTWVSREELGNGSEVAHTGGSFGTYLGSIRSAGLVESEGDKLRVTQALWL